MRPETLNVHCPNRANNKRDDCMWDENKVRIIDIAEELGLSTATVSNVLHGKTKKISDATVKAVEKKLEESGYIANMAATLLARNNSRIIGVVVNNHPKYEGHVFEDSFISAAINFLSDEIERKNYFMMLKKARNIMDTIPFSTMWNLDGLILIGFCEDEYQNLRDHVRIPFVVYDGFMSEQSRFSDIKIDDFDGGRQVGTFLKEQGHKDVLCIADNDICMDLDRYNGLCSGLGHAADFLMIPMEKTERNAFYKERQEYILEHTAIFAVSDYYAIDIMSFLQQRGIQIPEDISIIGFDGSRDCTKTVPPLASVHQDNEQRAKKAVELLVSMMQNPDFRESICIPVTLQKGGSAGKCRRIGT